MHFLLLLAIGLTSVHAATCKHPVTVTSRVFVDNEAIADITCSNLKGQFNKPTTPAGEYYAAVEENGTETSGDACEAAFHIEIEDDVDGAGEFAALGARQKCENLGGDYTGKFLI